jgi:hypothetical protein
MRTTTAATWIEDEISNWAYSLDDRAIGDALDGLQAHVDALRSELLHPSNLQPLPGLAAL